MAKIFRNFELRQHQSNVIISTKKLLSIGLAISIYNHVKNMNSGFFSPVLKRTLEEKKESPVNALAKPSLG